MIFYAYIIYSKSIDVYYKGMTSNLQKRLYEHNNGLSRYTKKSDDWEIVFYKSFKAKREALIYERKLKRQNRGYLLWLIKSDKNELKK